MRGVGLLRTDEVHARGDLIALWQTTPCFFYD